MGQLKMRDLLGEIPDLRCGMGNIKGDVLEEVLNLVEGFQEVNADGLMGG
jgi:hypothetical protein